MSQNPNWPPQGAAPQPPQGIPLPPQAPQGYSNQHGFVPPVGIPLQYQTPTPGSDSRELLRDVARKQQALLYCLLANIVIYNLYFSLHLYILTFLIMAGGLVGAVCLFMLAIRVSGIVSGIVWGLVALIPFLGIISLLIINARATTLLRSNGIKVGLMGADPKAI